MGFKSSDHRHNAEHDRIKTELLGLTDGLPATVTALVQPVAAAAVQTAIDGAAPISDALMASVTANPTSAFGAAQSSLIDARVPAQINSALGALTTSPTTVRTNLLLDPDCENPGVLNWGFVNAGSGATYAKSTDRAHSGTQSMKVTYGAATTMDAGVSTGNNVVAGVTYRASAYIYIPALGASGGFRAAVFGAGVGGTLRGSAVTTINDWVRVDVSFVAAANGFASIGIFKVNNGSIAGTVIYVDDLLLEASLVLGDAFSGSTPASGGISYAWTAAANASTSTKRVRAIANYDSVLDFGAVNDGSHDDSDAFTAAIEYAYAHGHRVWVPAGSYNITKRIRLRPGTFMVGYGAVINRNSEMGTIFVNWPLSEEGSIPSRTFGGYDGWGGITLIGLTLDAHGDTFTSASNIVTFNHGRDITLRDCTFRRTLGYHSLELNAVSDFIVDNCKFLGFIAVTGIDNKEAIQIDSATDMGIDAGLYDNTVTGNGVIKGCYFGPYQAIPSFSRGLGSHSRATGLYYKNIKVSNCTFDGCIRAIQTLAWQDCTFTNCTVNNSTDAGIYLSQSVNCRVIGGGINASGPQGINVTGGSVNTLISGCIIDGTSGEGVHLGELADSTTVIGCVIRHTASYAVIIIDSSNNLVSSNFIDGAGYTAGALGAIRVSQSTGATANNSIVGNKVKKHGAGTEVAAGVAIKTEATNTWVFGNDFLGLAAAISGTANTTSNRI